MAAGGSDLESSLTKSSSPGGSPRKVILLGVKGVGKTSLFHCIFRFKENESSDENCRELNFTDYFEQPITVNGRTVQMRLWDTAGMEGNRHQTNLTRSYYVEAQVALLVYSADDWDSVEYLKDYVNELQNHAPGAAKFLIRNKVDLPKGDQLVNEKDVDAMFKKHCPHLSPKGKLETSAFTGEGIETLLNEVGKALLRQGTITPNERNSFQVYRQKPNSKRSSDSSSCC